MKFKLKKKNLEKINSRFNNRKEWRSKLKDSIVKITQDEQNQGNEF